MYLGYQIMEQKVERKLRGSMVLAVVFTIIFALFSTPAVWAVPNVVRGPYLQNGTPNSVTIMWRTSENTSSKVWYGTSLGTLNRSVMDSDLKTDHTILVSGLSPGTKYYYQVGMTDGTVLAGGDLVHYFVTSPNSGSTGPIRIWVLGDSGRANNNARSVKNAYLELADNEKDADIWLMLGDNAYNSGTDTEYQNAVFNMYPEILRNKVLWSTRGNHEMSSSVYYGIFDLPTNGEGGGLASGTEHYYSFDYANIHFICLNSQESNFSGSPGSAMYEWLEDDLANTRQKWIIAFWHHPPYSKGSHNSDTEGKLIDMRQNALPILEAGGVDLVLAGHSHSYERSLFINGHYAHSSSFDPDVHVVQAGSGREDGDGAYVKSEDDGTVYIVAGSSGGVSGGSINHPVMYFSEKQLGSLIIDVQGSRMDVRFLREYTNTQVDDYFTIQDTSLTAMFVGPSDGLTDVPPRGVVLRWIPGEYASKHDVYFGTNFDDVNDATATVGPGGVYLARQDPNYYPISGALDLGETYYWRVDEVNGPPDFTVFEGEVWSFTTEPFSYPIENITATASSTHQTDTGPENTINGSGLDVKDLHSTEATDMWLSGEEKEPNRAWIEYELDKVYKLHAMWVWNSNQTMELLFGFGLKDVTIEYSTNGTDYTTLGTTHEFARAPAPGTPDYAHNTTVDFSSVTAKYVRLTANSNWGSMDRYGLSEVRFFSIPVFAREPSPDSGTTDVAVDVTLGFRAGREAAEHNVYLSSDEQAVINGNAPVTTVTENSFGPLSLDSSTTYYWRVDEVNEAETTTTWQSEIWNFTTTDHIIVDNFADSFEDDFENYNDYPPYEIWATWVDGYGVSENGSTVGHAVPPFAEQTIVHGGNQSMPFFYSNTGGAAYSEAKRTFAVPQDLTAAGEQTQTLTLYFRGTAGNTGQLYVKVNGSKIVYGGDPSNLARAWWQAWNINLASFGVDLQSVTTMAIGVDGSGAGTLYFDDISLAVLVWPGFPFLAE